MKLLIKGLKNLKNFFKKEPRYASLTPKQLARKVRKIKMLYPFHKVIVVNGCFDLLHAGHNSMLFNAKRYGYGLNILVVGVNSDRSISKLKGPTRPIINEKARLFSLQQIKSVDFAFIFDSTDFSKHLAEFGECIFIKGEDYKEITKKELTELKNNGGFWSTVGSDFDITTTEICKKIRDTSLT